MQQTWEWQQPSAHASTMQPASLLPSHAWDVWQSDGQGVTHGQESYNNCIYPPGTYTANQNQGAGGSYYSTPGMIPQETWHTDPAPYNPDSQAPPAAAAGAVVSGEGCTQTAPYGSCFGSYPTAYQQDWPWSYASADSGTPEPNVYYAGAPYPNGDHPLYLDHAAEQQRQIEHAQYLISRWGASDDSTPALDSASPVMSSSAAQGAHSSTVFPAAAAPYNHVQDQHWTPPAGEGTATSSLSSSWGTFATRPQCTSWSYNLSHARAAVREHGSQTQAPPAPAPAAAAAAAAAMSSERRQQSWTPKEFQPDDQDEQRSMELSPSSATAAAK